MRRLAFINEKGGSCKTTLAVNVSAWLAMHGRKCLLVDMDPQGQAGKCLGIDVRPLDKTVFEMLLGRAAPEEVIVESAISGLDIIPANKRLASFPEQVASIARREYLLADRLSSLSGYDYLLIDSPPSMGLVNTNILLAAEELIVPVNLTYLALDGCAEIVESVESVREKYGHHRLHIALVVPTLYRPTRLADEVLQRLRMHFPGRVSRTVIGFNVKIDEAQSHGKSIFEYASWSRGAHMLEQLSREIEKLRQA
ncbi:MAG: ParA family protein [Deltaproteobacteria bacterium]|nr:MAG: ParA family protein [Deltaproteobacteria bacterium]